MSEDQKVPVEPETNSNAEVDSLKAEVERMRKKNADLLKEYKTLGEKIKTVPDDVNVQELIDFKHNREQKDLEVQGKYSEAKDKLEQQYREKTSEKDKKIADLESKVRELELVSPAVSALSELVHDPNLVLKNYLTSEQIEIGEGGTPVVVNGYERTPITDWAREKLPAFQLKQAKAVGSGAPIAKSTSGEFSQEMLKPFLSETQNLSEQKDIYNKYGRDTWAKLREIAAKR